MPTVYTSRDAITAQANLIPVQYLGDKVFLLDPNENPFSLITRLAKKRVVGALSFKTQDDVIYPEWYTLQAGSGVTSWIITTDNGTYVKPWDILYDVNTGTMCQVTSISTDTLTVVDNIDGGGASTAQAAGDIILRLGNAMEEGVGVPTARSTQETTITNYIQRVSTPMSTTYPAKNSAYHYTGSDFMYQNKKAMIQHTRMLDSIFLMNGVGNDFTVAAAITLPADGAVTNGTAVTMGLRGFIATYADAALNRTETDLTETEFYEWVKDAFLYGSSEKILFASNRLIQALMMWNIGRGQFIMETSKATKTLGLQFASVTTPHGVLKVINHKLLAPKASTTPCDNFIVDMENIGYVYFKGLDTTVMRNVVQDGSHKQIDEISTYCGTEFHLANTHAKLRFTSFS
ncbi:SU10 major capsid protein [Candidatus Methylomirabilis sp.]|uniref:SU10 major capsid protein n=1 Tax=Candidatus Methylomirabilis sp. TaxID=2032687 RepID=UPI003C71494E